jgi:hypothetical protein
LYLRSARFGRSDRHRVQYAVQAHLDPGAGLREKAERYSRQRHRDRWFLSFELAVLVLFIATISPWDDTGRAWLGATLVVVPYLVRFIDSWHLGAAGRRWLENPPGPSRD